MITLTSSHSLPVPIPIPLLYLSRTPFRYERPQAVGGVCAFAWQKYARHSTEPCRTPGKGLEYKPLEDRTLPAEPHGSVGPRHVRKEL